MRRELRTTVCAALVVGLAFICGAGARCEDGAKAKITVDVSGAAVRANPLVFGQFIEHLGKCIKDGLWTPDDRNHKLVLGGVREDLYDALKQLNIPLLRWPGGCFSDGYHWKDGIGPRERRPLRRNLAWARDKEETPSGPKEDNAFGTDEFLRLCESLGIEPLINVNLGSGTAEEARQWVEYANGAPDTEYGKLRALNGHPKPYGVKLWGIGNESWGDYEIGYFKTGAEYAVKYLEFAREMKRADPNIKLLAVGSLPINMPWNRDVLTAAGAEADYLSLHVYFPGLTIIPTDKMSPKMRYYGSMAAGRELDTIMDDFDGQIMKYAPAGSNVRMSLDEWNLWWNDTQIVRSEDYEFSSALFTADILIRLLRRGDRLGFANFAQLVNVLALVITDPEKGLYVTPSYYPFQLFGRYVKGDLLAPVKADGPKFTNVEYGIVKPGKGNPCIEAVAFTDAARSRLDLVVINKHYDKNITADIELKDFSSGAKCVRYEINAPSTQSKNSFDNPNALKGIERGECPKPDATGLAYDFPAHSITLLSFSR